MMPGAPGRPSDHDLGWDRHVNPQALAMICTEIKVPDALHPLYVVDHAWPTVTKAGTLDHGPRTTVTVSARGDVDSNSVDVIVDRWADGGSTVLDLLTAVRAGLDWLGLDALAADVRLDGYAGFPEGAAEQHSTMDTGQGASS